MHIQALQLSNFRNLTSVGLKPSPGVNLFVGANASGKTSLLEAIYLLSLVRSFRSKKLNSLIQHEQDNFTVFCQLLDATNNSSSLGIERTSAAAETSILLNSQKPAGVAELSQLLPVQLINPDAFRLLEGGPKDRRHFLDWGVFHVEQEFIFAWRRFQQALKQRNMLLRRGKLDALQLQVWEDEISKQGESITLSRAAYLAKLQPIFDSLLAEFLPELEVKISFLRGWDKNTSLADSLLAAREKDAEQGFTQVGPQRADLRVSVNSYPAMEVLSRGQLKLVVAALKLAQGKLLQNLPDSYSTAEKNKALKKCIYLIDDLPAELDLKHRKIFCKVLEQQACQVFVTGVEQEALAVGWQSPEKLKWFHVKQGQINSFEIS